jgi:hypothetical protein
LTDTGAEAIPFATTTSELGPVSIPFGSVNLAEDAAPGATESEVMPVVRAYVTSWVASLVIRTRG